MILKFYVFSEKALLGQKLVLILYANIFFKTVRFAVDDRPTKRYKSYGIQPYDR